MINCPSCKRKFTEDEAQIGCGTCSSLSSGCGKLRCPHCKYEFTQTPGIPAIFHTIAGLFKRSRKDSNQDYECPGSTLLAHLRAGEDCIVEKFLDVAQVRKFISLGILPGTHVTIIKHNPVVIVRIGYSEFAFDQTLAKTVQVHRIAA